MPFEFGSDGEEYYEVLDVAPALLAAYDVLIRAGQVYRQAAAVVSDPNARRDAEVRAALVDRVVAQVSVGADKVARDTATFATRMAKTLLDQRIVRPKGSGDLRAALFSRSIKTRPIGTLEVGVGALSALDGGPAEPYWKAQEFGSSHLVGRKIKGYFQPGSSPASPAEFRNHPVFELDASGPQMLITRPIEAKHFLRDAALEARAFRATEFSAVEATAMRELDLVNTGTHPSAARYARAAIKRRLP